MSLVDFTLVIKNNKIPGMLAEMPDKADKAVRKITLDWEAKAKTIGKRVSGANMASIYSVTSVASGYGQAAAGASAKARATTSTERSRSSFLFGGHATPRKGEALVPVAVKYGVITEHKVKPYMRPARDAVKAPFQAALRQVFEGV